MENKVMKILNAVVIMLTSFSLSFLGYNEVCFLVSLPLCLSLVLDKEINFIFSFLGAFFASFFINYTYMPMCFILIFLVTILAFILCRNREVKLNYMTTIVSVLDSFLLLSFTDIYSSLIISNYIVIPIVFGLLTYNFSSFIIRLKSKEKLSFSWYELTFMMTALALVFLNNSIEIFQINMSFVLGAIVVYSSCKINPYLPIIIYTILLVFHYPNVKEIETIILSLLLVFLMKGFRKHKTTGVTLYFAVSYLSMVLIKDYTYALELIVLTISILLIPNSTFLWIEKHVENEQEYEETLQRNQYYKALNKNRKICELIEIIKNKMKENPRMKKKYNEQIMSDLSFLISKGERQTEVNIKEKIMDELEYLKLDVLGIKIKENENEDVAISIEIRNHNDYKKIKNIIEGISKKRFSLLKGKYNFLTNVITYEFENKEEYDFDYVVKQKSVDEICGDSYLCFKANNKKYFLVSDGMGHGRKAYEDSRFSLFLLKSFIELGMDAKNAIISCNALVYSKNDTYNTLDLLEYDCYTNNFILYKNGSGNSYVQKRDIITNLVSQNLPLGIVDEISINEINLGNNVDRIILTSDGVGQNAIDIINENKHEEIKNIVNKILMPEDKIEDDQTIIAINVIKKEIV